MTRTRVTWTILLHAAIIMMSQDGYVHVMPCSSIIKLTCMSTGMLSLHGHSMPPHVMACNGHVCSFLSTEATTATTVMHMHILEWLCHGP